MFFEFEGNTVSVGKNEIVLAAKAVSEKKKIKLQGIVDVTPKGSKYFDIVNETEVHACICGIAAIMVLVGRGLVEVTAEDGIADEGNRERNIEHLTHEIACSFPDIMGAQYEHFHSFVRHACGADRFMETADGIYDLYKTENGQ